MMFGETGRRYVFVPVDELHERVTVPEDVNPARLERVTRILPPSMEPTEWVRARAEWLKRPPTRARRHAAVTP